MDHVADDRKLAHAAVTVAVRDGRLTPQPCVVCWALPTAAHHPRGYDEDHRLDVVWLCARCHERMHGRTISPGEPKEYRRLRESVGLSLRVVSGITGINRGRLSIIERGVMPTPDEAKLIIEALTPKPDAAA